MPETLHRGFLIRRFSRDDVQNQKLESVGEEEISLMKPKRFIERFKCVSKSSCLRHYGGYSVGVPPRPIPNREVKPVRADGTAYSGRVGSRRPFKSKCRFGESISSAALFVYSGLFVWPPFILGFFWKLLLCCAIGRSVSLIFFIYV